MGICHGKPRPDPDPSDLPPEERPPSPPPPPAEETRASATTSPARGAATPRREAEATPRRGEEGKGTKSWASPFFPFYSPSPGHGLFSSKKSPKGGGSNAGTPRRLFKRPFPPPSPAKHIRAVLARRHGSVKPNEASIPEDGEVVVGVTGLDKTFGFGRNFESKYDLGEEVGRGHFGYTCSATIKKGELKGHEVAVKVIPKVKVRTKKERKGK